VPPLVVARACALILAALVVLGCQRVERADGTGETQEGTTAADTTDTLDTTDTTAREPDSSFAIVAEEPTPDATVGGTPPVSEQASDSDADEEKASEGETVDWMRVDETAKKVTFDVVAGLTPENSAWNFNGYANGEMTITVPVGWTVVMNFTSRDADVPHSLFITDLKPPFPAVMPTKPAFPKAFSVNLQNGIGPGRKDTLRFTADKPGEYIMACGVPGHAASGMWDYFVVSAEAQRPQVTVR
jgi:sulfocyanin